MASRHLVTWAVGFALCVLGGAARASYEARIYDTASDDLQNEGMITTRHLLGDAEDKRLWHAASAGNVKGVEKALADGANVDVQLFKFKKTPIIEAIQKGHGEVVTVLINANANLEIGDKDGETPLISAVLKEDLELVKELLAAGASPNGDPSLDSGPTGGADVNETTVNGTTGAVEAQTTGVEDEVAKEKGVKKSGKHKKKHRGLLQVGADPNGDAFSVGAADPNARQPGLPATSGQGPATGAPGSTSTIPAAAGTTPGNPGAPGTTSTIPANPGTAPAVPSSPQAGALPANGTQASDDVAVDPAVNGGSENGNRRGDRSKGDSEVKLTPLVVAAATGNAAIVKVLLEAGAIADLTDDLGDTPLHKASLMLGPGSLEIANMLLAENVDVDVRGFGGRTPLFSASEFANVPVLKALLEAGANPAIEDVDSMTAVDVICDCASLERFNLCPDGRCERRTIRRTITRLLKNAPKPQGPKGTNTAEGGNAVDRAGAPDNALAPESVNPLEIANTPEPAVAVDATNQPQGPSRG